MNLLWAALALGSTHNEVELESPTFDSMPGRILPGRVPGESRMGADRLGFELSSKFDYRRKFPGIHVQVIYFLSIYLTDKPPFKLLNRKFRGEHFERFTL